MSSRIGGAQSRYCKIGFEDWLRQRFDDDVDALNAAWGTAFWSQQYNGFDEIYPPRDTADRTANDGANPNGGTGGYGKVINDSGEILLNLAFNKRKSGLFKMSLPPSPPPP